MQEYLRLLKTALERGEKREDRTGTGTLSLFGYQARYDLSEGFPLITTKKLHLRSIIHELLWFLNGDTNTQYLHDNKVTIWDEWADAEGNLGPIYGFQWRHWGRDWPLRFGDEGKGVDQIRNVVEGIRKNPSSRRHIVSAWNPGDLPKMKLPPCHALFQFYVHQDGRLSCQLYQRSADIFLGVPFNIASYALLTMMVAQCTDLRPGEFIHTMGDAHLYLNHVDQARLQLERAPRALPTMRINADIREIDHFQFTDFSLENYDPHPAIAAPIAV